MISCVSALNSPVAFCGITYSLFSFFSSVTSVKSVFGDVVYCSPTGFDWVSSGATGIVVYVPSVFFR